MQRIMLLNPKGGSGKTTIATSLAGFYAGRHMSTLLIDHDAQGSSTRWLGARSEGHPVVRGVAAFRSAVGVTRSWQLRAPPGTERVVVDTPAGLRLHELEDLVRRADVVVVPVLPSLIDIDAARVFLGQLAALAPVQARRTRVAVLANRVRARTTVWRALRAFLSAGPFPFVATLRDSQHYVRAAEQGLGIHELPDDRTAPDLEQWLPLLEWIEDGPIDGAAVPDLFDGPASSGLSARA
jgi:chromosome partitioning protein